MFDVGSRKEVSEHTFVLAFRYLIGPHTDSGFTVVSESRTALVSGSLSVPAIPEYVAFLFVGEDTVEARTMRRANRWFELCPVSAIYVVEVVAIFSEELAVACVEGESVAASFQFRDVVIAFPIFVAGYMMRIETKIVWAFERFLGGCAYSWKNVLLLLTWNRRKVERII